MFESIQIKKAPMAHEISVAENVCLDSFVFVSKLNPPYGGLVIFLLVGNNHHQLLDSN